MKKVLGMLLTVAMCVTMVTPAFANTTVMLVKEDGVWKNATDYEVYALTLGEQFAGIPDEKERLTAIANYIKNNFEWDLNFVSGLDALKEGKTGSFDALYRCMLNGAGITVIGSTDNRLVNCYFDNTQLFTQDLVVEIQGKRYWTSALMYKYYGDKYLLCESIPQDENVQGFTYDLDMNYYDPYEGEVLEEVTGVVLGSCLDD